MAREGVRQNLTALTARRPERSDMRAIRHDELALYHAAAAKKKCSCGESDWHVVARKQGIRFTIRYVKCRRCGATDQIVTRR